ncbi:rod shape-determining protein MreC [Lysobacter olei]
MPPYAGPPTPPRSGEIADSLRLMVYLGLAVALIVLDHRGGWLHEARRQMSLVVQPLWAVAGWPGQAMRRVQADAGTLGQLTDENRRLRQELLLSQARMARLRTVAADNERLRGLLDAAQTSGVDVQLAPVLDIDLDPARQRLVVRAGTGDGVRVGQSVIDAGGLLGQVIETSAGQSTVLLITDPSHAVPVAVVRNGVRLVAYGSGEGGHLRLANVPTSSDVKVGDELITSGLGGRFPAGFMVGTIVDLRPDESRAYLQGEVRPAAQLDRGRDVLLLRAAPAMPAASPTPVGAVPPGPDAAMQTPQGTTTGGAGVAPTGTTGATGTGAVPVVPAPAPATLPIRYPRRAVPTTQPATSPASPSVAATASAPASTTTSPASGAAATGTGGAPAPRPAVPAPREPAPPASQTTGSKPPTDEGARR